VKEAFHRLVSPYKRGLTPWSEVFAGAHRRWLRLATEGVPGNPSLVTGNQERNGRQPNDHMPGWHAFCEPSRRTAAGGEIMNIEGRLSRRRFLGGTGTAVLGAASGIACPRLVFAQSKKSIQFTLPWVAEGSNLFTFVAKGMGF
jgi:hypothetical protein